ncbi:hypothetical protein L228DRAFT_264355 [Xylona heveae TC161]|uniref:Uncharacterized protein n=1 Tax=Xylona heveae (strain CBS 132557 / TC161) TaxID=1328760 RepID=A0A165J946_XYLHT|nr:hypothetical protein L228DRAFT_264355 [Xylona heveae TC161]KZF25918.1 hypothetical protein L228DRAFT_264355 [Xylona heveae TC161]
MQVAEILSDLTSLQVCGHDEASALVNAHKTLGNAKAEKIENQTQMLDPRDDPDLQRANDVMELHAAVKLKHSHGVDEALQRSRADVRRILSSLTTSHV